MPPKNLLIDEKFLTAFLDLTDKILLVQNKVASHIKVLDEARHVFESVKINNFTKYRAIIIPVVLIIIITVSVVILNQYGICGKAGYQNLFIEIKCQ